MIPIDNQEKEVTAVDQEEVEVITPEEEAPETAEVSPENAEPSKPEKKKKEKKSSKNDELAAAAEQYAALNDRYLRLCAEYDNFRKRSQKEKDALYGDIKANVISSMLPVYDNLERALAAPTEDEAYRKGVEMIMTQFNTTLEKLGITPIPDVGEKFNPELHNAVMHTEDEEKGENEITEVFQKGFACGDKVIRPSMVKVAN